MSAKYNFITFWVFNIESYLDFSIIFALLFFYTFHQKNLQVHYSTCYFQFLKWWLSPWYFSVKHLFWIFEFKRSAWLSKTGWKTGKKIRKFKIFTKKEKNRENVDWRIPNYRFQWNPGLWVSYSAPIFGEILVQRW